MIFCAFFTHKKRLLITDKHKNAIFNGNIKQKLNSITKPSNDDIAYIFVTIVGTSIFESASKSSDVDVMNANITRSLSEVTGLSNDSRMRTFLNMYMKGCSDRMNNAFYKGWLEATLNK